MSLTNDINVEIYRQMAELQEKLRKSEEERMRLEEKFRFLMKSCREDEEIRLRNLQERYSRFIEDCNKRNDRNDQILRSLEKVESSANVLFAKTERLKLLRSHYEAYLERIMPQWKQQHSLTYKPSYTSHVQPSVPFKSPFPSRLTTSNDYLSSYSIKYAPPEPAPTARTMRGFEESDLLLKKDKPKPFLRERSLSSGSFLGTDVRGDVMGSYPYPETLTEEVQLEKPRTPMFVLPDKIIDGLEKRIEKKLTFYEEKPKFEEPLVHPPRVEDSAFYAYRRDPIVEREDVEIVEPYQSMDREKQEIECLVERDEKAFSQIKQPSVDLILSDDEVLDNAAASDQMQFVTDRPVLIKKPELSVGRLPTEMTRKFEASKKMARFVDPVLSKPNVYEPYNEMLLGEEKRDEIPEKSFKNEEEIAREVSPLTKRGIIEHQRSIDQLKAALSIEDDIEKEERRESEERFVKSQVESVASHHEPGMNEETDVTESSSEVWHPPEVRNEHPGGYYVQDHFPPQGDNVVSETDEIENQFTEVMTDRRDERYVENEKMPPEVFYEEQQQYEVDPNEEEHYPESYYEQPPPPAHYPTNIASNVILEEDEYEAEQAEYAQQNYEQHPEGFVDNQYLPEQVPIYEENVEYVEHPDMYPPEGMQYEQDQVVYQEGEGDVYPEQYDPNQVDYEQQNLQYQEGGEYDEQRFVDYNQQQENYIEGEPQNYDQENYGQPYDPNYIPEGEYVEGEIPQEEVIQQPYGEQVIYDEDGSMYAPDDPQIYEGEMQQGEVVEQPYREQVMYNEDGSVYAQDDPQMYEGEYQQQMVEGGEYQEGAYEDQQYQNNPEENVNYVEEPRPPQPMHPKQPVLAHLLESDSESYQVEHGAVTGNEDSDFDFSISQHN